MTYAEVVAAAQTKPALDRAQLLYGLTRRKDLTADQRDTAIQQVLPLIPDAVPLEFRFWLMQALFRQVIESKLDAFFQPALARWMETLDAVARSQERVPHSIFDRGEIHKEYTDLIQVFEDRHMTATNPSILARKVLRSIDAFALEQVNFSLAAYDGKQYRLSELRGKVVLLDFWATWCEPCRKELPTIEKLHHDLSAKGVVVLGIDDEKPDLVRSFSAEHGLSFPTLIDTGHKVHDLFGVEGIPAVAVINRDGGVVDRVPFPHTEENFLTVLKQAGLRQSTTPVEP